MLGVLTDRQNTVEESPVDEQRGGGGGIEDEEQQLEQFILPTVPDNCGPQTVSLATLIELAVGHTNRDFQILAELLQKKSEMDRKVSILSFATSTRVVFLKLYALVKWLKGSKKFDQLTSICYFLDQLSDYFVDTADNFVQIAREELVFARLPTFQITTAADMLSSKTFLRLPASIKTKYIDELPLTKRQRKLTVKWMHIVINYRLIQESSNIPSGFAQVKVSNGVVTFTSPNEFKVSMALEPTACTSQEFDRDTELAKWRWKVCAVEILISDYEIGFGSSLVHPLQHYWLVDFCNQKLKHSDDDIRIVYEILHDFTLKLQLDILFCQAQHLSKTISERYVAVEVYDSTAGLLAILYWLPDTPGSDGSYRITVERDPNRPCGGLVLRHHPFNSMLPTLSSGTPDLYRLFNKTIMFRCRERLYKIKRIVKRAISKSSHIRLIGDAAVRLSYNLLDFDDVTEDEYWNVVVNTFTGRIQCSVPMLTENLGVVDELEELLNSSYPNIDKILDRLLRIQELLLLKRYRLAATSFQFQEVRDEEVPMTDKLNDLPVNRLYFQFSEDSQFYLILTLDFQREADPDIRLFLLDFTPAKLSMVELRIEELIRSAAIADLEESEVDIRTNYKAMCSRQSFVDRAKQIQVAMFTVANRILFIRIFEELRKHGIQFEHPVCEPEVGGYIMKLKDVSSILDKNDINLFDDNFTECNIRWSSISHVWPFECTLKDIPLISDYKQSKGKVTKQRSRLWTHVEEISPWQPQITSLADAVNAHVVDRLRIYTNMISAIRQFSIAYDEYFHEYCNIFLFNYHKLMLLYGENREKVCILSWKPKMNGFLINFAQNTCHSQNTRIKLINIKWNSHAYVYDILSNKYNTDHNLVDLVNYLIHTDRSMQCIFYFSTLSLRTLKTYPMLALSEDRCVPIEMRVNVSALTENHIRMSYGVSCVDFQLLNENRCLVQAFRITDPLMLTEKNEYVSLPLFKEFWTSISNKKAIFIKNEPSSSANRNQPLSVPQNRASSPQDPGPLSCPPQVDILTSDNNVASNLSVKESSGPSDSPAASVLVDIETFERAMAKTELERPGAFEMYLQGINFISRMGSVFECLSKNTPQRPYISFSNYSYDSSSIRFEIIGIPVSNVGVCPWSVFTRIYLCPCTFTVKCKLTISGANVPSGVDVEVFERFFEKAVAPIGSEFAVMSFMTMCRISALPIFVSFARLMQAHMECLDHTNEVHPEIVGLSNLWCVNLQLVNTQGKIQSGVTINDKNIIITLNLHSIRTRRDEKTEVRRILLHYNMETNKMTSKPQRSYDEVDRQDYTLIECLLQEVWMTYRKECLIWPSIRCILEKFRSFRPLT